MSTSVQGTHVPLALQAISEAWDRKSDIWDQKARADGDYNRRYHSDPVLWRFIRIAMLGSQDSDFSARPSIFLFAIKQSNVKCSAKQMKVMTTFLRKM